MKITGAAKCQQGMSIFDHIHFQLNNLQNTQALGKQHTELKLND